MNYGSYTDLNKGYYTLMTERMSVNNADILAKFVNSNRKERNIAINTVISYILMPQLERKYLC